MENMKWHSPSQVLNTKHVSYPQLTATGRTKKRDTNETLDIKKKFKNKKRKFADNPQYHDQTLSAKNNKLLQRVQEHIPDIKVDSEDNILNVRIVKTKGEDFNPSMQTEDTQINFTKNVNQNTQNIGQGLIR